jgi:hypothetical protein
MAAIDNFTPSAGGVIRLFAYSFRSAPTADLIALGANELGAGQTPAGLLDFLYNFPVPQSPFTAYARIASDSAFATAFVENMTLGMAIDAATKSNWVGVVAAALPTYRTRGEFGVAIAEQIESYAGSDAQVLALKAGLAQRLEKAALFALSPAGAVYDGNGFGQLTAPLAPPVVPTYELSASAASVDEGGSVTFTLQTTGVSPGTSVDYALSGNGITALDLIGATLAGTFTVNAAGIATTTIALAADATTEGPETLRLALADNRGQLSVTVNDTSLTPPPPPATFTLTASASAVDEGASVTYTLITTNVQVGTVVGFTLAGTGIAAADITGGAVTGQFSVNDQGIGTATVGLAADNLTEGTELLRLTLDNGRAQIQTTINDTSLTPPPVGTPDTVIVADNINNNRAHAPASAQEGEIPLDTYLTYDLLNQAGINDVRMTVAGLKATNPVAGAPLDLTNQSADRGNIPQLSNQGLMIYDLGLATDRVDYSAETGKVVALVTSAAPTNTQYMLVNDDGTNDFFGGATDRLDILRDVEEVVAPSGVGVIDLTNSFRDWQITYSRNFDASTAVDAARDRATHVVGLVDAATGSADARTLLEFRDAGQSATITQPTAVWSQLQGSDRNETIQFSSAQASEAFQAVLRGGTNAARYFELTRSIVVDVTITPWVPSTNLADDTNASGRTTANVVPTTGDGVTPLSANTHVITSHTPDNGVAAGKLELSATQDAEDAISFSGTPQPKWFLIGSLVTVRLASGPDAAAMQITGFEFLRDNGASDDTYSIDSIFRATQGNPRLTDAAGNDHDTVRLADEALGSAAVGGAPNAVNLTALNGAAPGFGFDFDVLDLSTINGTGLQVTGTAGSDDELVVGRLASVSSVSQFEALVLTRNSIDKGISLTLDLDAGAIKAGGVTLFSYGGSVLSAGGTVFGSAGQDSAVPPVDQGLNLTVIDSTAGAGATLWGGSNADLLVGGVGNDVLRGGDGNDVLDGGVPTGGFTETWAFTIGGTPDAVAADTNRITIAMTIDGAALTLTEAAVADTSYGDGNGAVVDGASRNTIGTAMAALINANLATINAGPGTGTLAGASYDSSNGVVLLTYLGGVNATDVVTFVLNAGAGPDGGNFALSGGVNINGGNGGVDTFVFERTASLNGRDTILNFTAGSDKLDFSAFAGAPIAVASPSIDGAVGGNLAGVPTAAEFVFNKAQALLQPSDFSTAAGAGKFVLADGGRCIVAVTADPTGARGDGANTAVSIYFVENGAAAGLSDLRVSLVGTVSGPVELSLAEIFVAMS